MDQLIVDQEFKDWLWPLKPEEYSELEKSIMAEGCRDSIITWDGIIVDGHNRYEICTKHNIGFNTIGMEFDDRDSVALWIWNNQNARRNLTQYQRSVSALKAEPLIAAKAKAEQIRKPADSVVKNSAQQNPEDNKTRHKVATAAGVSHDTIAKVKKLEAKANPELKAKLATGEVSINKAHNDIVREEKRQEIIEKLEDVQTRENKAIEGVYDVVVIDPPWPMQKIERDVTPNQVAFEYPTMEYEQLKSFTVPCADDCHVWVWTTQRFLPMCLDLLKDWGLKYVLTMVWHKNGGFQPFGMPQYNCEFAVYARKGTPTFIDTKAFPTCFNADRTEHSAKPNAFYDIVRRVTAGRRIDIFNRREIDGFDTWGNESQ